MRLLGKIHPISCVGASLSPYMEDVIAWNKHTKLHLLGHANWNQPHDVGEVILMPRYLKRLHDMQRQPELKTFEARYSVP
jgi:hypothetical protein